MATILPDPISLTTHHLHMGYSPTDALLSSGTGFIYEQAASFYLVTNWHNVAGRHPETGACLSKTLATPDIVSTMFRDTEQPGVCRRESLQLYRDNGMRDPAWFEHPVLGRRVDVVALPLPERLSASYRLFPINGISFDAGYKDEVADDAFIVGYPFAELAYLQLPIWKRATIATEPDVDVDQLPKILVDTATRPGLSGSPVIRQRTGIHGMDQGMPTKDTVIGRIRSFLGIYSGRIGNDEAMAQLGIVWKATVIGDIVDGKVFGKSPHLA